MKKHLFLYAAFLLLAIIPVAGRAQAFGLYPFQPNPSPLFGQDIPLCDLPHQNQRTLAICSAPNGWLYAVYGMDSINFQFVEYMRSKDNGATWEKFGMGKYYGTFLAIKATNFEIRATGEFPNEHKLIFNSTNSVVYPDTCSEVEWLKINCEPFKFDTTFLGLQIRTNQNISISDDYPFPALGSNPSSMGSVYMHKGPNQKDSLVFRYSTDGGQTFNGRQILSVTSKKMTHVSLAYGRSQSQNSGRYFAVWEEESSPGSGIVNIYTSHSNPNFNSPFTPKVKLDGLDPSFAGKCRNPVIACQVDDVDNDSSNLTVVILAEKLNDAGDGYDIVGFFNKRGATGTTFQPFTLAGTPANERQPRITYNPSEHQFYITYFDSTAGKLPLLAKSLNMEDPGNWTVVTPAFNDTPGLTHPTPAMTINSQLHQPCMAWISDRESGKGEAMFDAWYPLQGSGQRPGDMKFAGIKVWPNPGSDRVSFQIDLKRSADLSIRLYDARGVLCRTIVSDTRLGEGSHEIPCRVSDLCQGVYQYRISCGQGATSGTLVVVR